MYAALVQLPAVTSFRQLHYSKGVKKWGMRGYDMKKKYKSAANNQITTEVQKGM